MIARSTIAGDETYVRRGADRLRIPPRVRFYRAADLLALIREAPTGSQLRVYEPAQTVKANMTCITGARAHAAHICDHLTSGRREDDAYRETAAYGCAIRNQQDQMLRMRKPASGNERSDGARAQAGIPSRWLVLQFPYRGYTLNLLDTPGHQDFGEDTYRTLMAADSAVMLIDAAKGVEPQTKKLFAICRERGIPLFTFMNKLDRPSRDPLELLDELESVLGIGAFPMNWPLGSGEDFRGVTTTAARAACIASSVSRTARREPRLPLRMPAIRNCARW